MAFGEWKREKNVKRRQRDREKLRIRKRERERDRDNRFSFTSIVIQSIMQEKKRQMAFGE